MYNTVVCIYKNHKEVVYVIILDFNMINIIYTYYDITLCHNNITLWVGGN